MSVIAYRQLRRLPAELEARLSSGLPTIQEFSQGASNRKPSKHLIPSRTSVPL
jgi:hypothetical protein